MTMSHHDELRAIAAPTKPHSSFKIRSQLKITWKTKTPTDIHSITNTLLCDCKNFWIGKFNAYANSCGIINRAKWPTKRKIDVVNIY